MDVHQLEAATDDPRIAEFGADLFGVALVATSKSLGVMPSSMSRTQPPTR
jgi:hypothetical protein